MQGFYDPQTRHIDIVMDGYDTDESHLSTDRRAHSDRRKKERRNSKTSSKSASNGMMQPILTQAEIAVLLRGAR